MLNRHITHSVLNHLHHSPAVAILGARQVGKTTLAMQIMQSFREKSIYLDLENPRDLAKLEDTYSYLHEHRDKLVIIDEVQIRPDLFSVLRPLMDSAGKNGMFLLLGSASPVLVKGVSESLTGRITYCYLTPFHLLETGRAFQISKHWFRGGFPRALLEENESVAKKWLDDFIKSYAERDLPRLFNVNVSGSLVKNLWTMIASANGGPFHPAVYARSLGVSAPTVSRYVEFLEGAYLLRRHQPWFISIRKRLVKSPKLYFRDTGILHRLCNIGALEELYGHIIAGYSWEGYVIEQILQIASPELSGYFYRTHDDSECDLVLVKGIKPVASIEIKLSNSPKIMRGFYISIEDLKTKKNYVITPSSEEYPVKNALVCGLRTFLEKHLPEIK